MVVDYRAAFFIPLHLAVDSIVFLALPLQIVVSQVPQHFRSNKMKASCAGCFVCCRFPGLEEILHKILVDVQVTCENFGCFS